MKKNSLKKLLISRIILATFVSLFVSIVWILHVIQNEVRETEGLILDNEIKVFVKTFDTKVETLKKIASDWAFWDEAYKFVLTKDKSEKERFIAENFGTPLQSTLTELDIDGMLFLDNNKNLVYAVVKKDLEGQKNAIVKRLYPYLDGNVKLDGFLELNNIPVYFVVRPITKTSGKSQAGYLLVFKQINNNFLQSIVPYEFFELVELDLPLDGYEMEMKLDGFRFVVYPINVRYKYIKVFARAIDGTYVPLASILFKRKISEAGMSVLFASISIILIGFSIFSLIIWYSLKSFVINPISYLSTFLKGVINSHDYSLRINEEFSAKELEELKESVNNLLENLEKSLDEVNQSLALFKAIAENVPAVIFLFDEKFHYVSRQIEDIVGIPSSFLLNQSVDEVLKMYKADPEIIKTFREKRARRKAGELISDSYNFEIDVRGEKRFLFAKTTTVYLDGNPFGLGIVVDITDRKKLEEKFKKLALEDLLTGLLNRTGFYEDCERVIKIFKREKRPFYMLLFDINKFKFINDQYGHDAGDKVLQEVGKRVKETIRDADIAARLGGDEFAIVLTLLNDDFDVIFFLKRLIDTIEKPIKVENAEIKPTISIGIATFPKDGDNINDLLKRADIAMYKAKERSHKTSKSEYKFFSQDLEEEIKWKASIEENLKRAILEHPEEIKVFYQPILDKNSKVVGFEALVRWFSPVLGNIPRSEFI